MQQDKTFLGTEPVGQLLRRLAIPTVIAQLVNMLYNIVDRIYIGHIPEVGSSALTGVGVCLPIILIVSAFACFTASGGAPRASIYMGRDDMDSAEKTLGGGFTLQIGISVVLTAVLLLWGRDALLAFGASENTIDYAADYLHIYAFGTLFVELTLGMNAFITAQGFAKVGMYTVLIGAAANIVLDPIFIFALGMGVRGAALATVLSQLASAAGAMLFLCGRRAAVRLERGGLSMAAAKKILALGFTPFAIIAIDNVMVIAMNAVLQRYGGAQMGDRLVTCAVIAQSFMLVMTMPLGGISGGTQSILSYNYGARQFDRVRAAQKKILALCMGFTAIMFVLARVAGPLFVRLFTQDDEVAALSVWAIRVCTLAAVPLGAQYEIVDGFTALGQVKISFPLSFFRKGVYFAALFILPACFGARAAFYAEPVSDIVGPLVSAIVYKLCIGHVLSDEHARI